MTEPVCKQHSPPGLSTAVGTCESGRNESGGGAGDCETTEVTTSFIFLFFSRAAVAIIFGPVKSRKSTRIRGVKTSVYIAASLYPGVSLWHMCLSRFELTKCLEREVKNENILVAKKDW